MEIQKLFGSGRVECEVFSEENSSCVVSGFTCDTRRRRRKTTAGKVEVCEAAADQTLFCLIRTRPEIRSLFVRAALNPLNR